MRSESANIVAIVGQGYVGLPLAMTAVDAGWKVIGIDSDPKKVSQINSGSSPVEDIPDLILQRALKSGFYTATFDPSTVTQASVITICVPTPLNADREPDLSILTNAVHDIAPYISDESLLISESTSFPGTLRDVIAPIIDANKNVNSKRIHLASAPERVNPGDSNWNHKNTPRLVGGLDEESRRLAVNFYESIANVVFSVSTPEIAEAAKLLENTFRLVNIGLINEFAQICAVNSINVHEVVEAASTKPYGFMAFKPGVGVGGHCIPVDPLYLTWWARQKKSRIRLVELADEVNLEMPKYVAERALALIDPSIRNPRILIIGVAYKPGIGDVRETPATELRNHLEDRGATVAWHDPLVIEWKGSKSDNLDWSCDIAILSVAHPGVDLTKLLESGSTVLDCTDTLPINKNVFSL